MTVSISRRHFIKGLLGAAGLTLAAGQDAAGAILVQKAQQAAGGRTNCFAPNAWLNISPDETITIYCSQCELGQGVFTSLPMIVAEELEADWNMVRVKQAPVAEPYKDPVWDSQVTAGSASASHFFTILRKAGAAARLVLVEAAAMRWGVPVSQCRASKGMVLHPGTGRSISYGRLALAAAKLPVVQDPALKDEKDFTLLGTSPKRIDALSKVNGTAVYGIDVNIPGMLYAVSVRPPAYGAKLKYLDKKAALSVKGVRRVVEFDRGIAVCADSIHAAVKGKKALAPAWSKGKVPDWNSQAVFKVLRDNLNTRGKVKTNRGSPEERLKKSAQVLEACYFLPYLAHAAMELMNCSVHVQKERCTIWAPCQNQGDMLAMAVEETGLPPERIEINVTFIGGSFGRRYEVDFVRDAIQIAKAAKRPVKHIWSREEDFKHDFYRPANCARIVAGLDEKGRITAWKHKVAAPSVYSRIAPSLLEDGIDPSAVESIHNSAYDFDNLHLEYVWIKEDQAPVPRGFWRSVGNSHNCFTIESFMDELAWKAGKDPLKFRLEHLKNSPRAKMVLEKAARMAGWPGKATRNRALGIAQHYLVYTYLAMVADVSVDTRTGAIMVHRVVCAVDCGRALHPEIVRQQVEGGILFGLSAALKEEVEFADGGVSTANFDDYPILTMSETPSVDVHIVESGERVTGVGEVGTAPIAPAVANAIYAAAGIRLRTLPITPSRVLHALGQKSTGKS